MGGRSGGEQAGADAGARGQDVAVEVVAPRAPERVRERVPPVVAGAPLRELDVPVVGQVVAFVGVDGGDVAAGDDGGRGDVVDDEDLGRRLRPQTDILEDGYAVLVGPVVAGRTSSVISVHQAEHRQG